MPGTKHRAGVQEALKKIAVGHPDVEEAIACKGTALESAVYKTRKKSFLFVGAAQARLKLDASLAEAKKLAKAKPGSVEVGAMGWAALSLGPDAPPVAVFRRWIAESYRLAAGPTAPSASGTGRGRDGRRASRPR